MIKGMHHFYNDTCYDRILGCRDDSDCPPEEHCEGGGPKRCVCGESPGKECDYPNGEVCKSNKCVNGALIINIFKLRKTYRYKQSVDYIYQSMFMSLL